MWHAVCMYLAFAEAVCQHTLLCLSGVCMYVSGLGASTFARLTVYIDACTFDEGLMIPMLWINYGLG